MFTLQAQAREKRPTHPLTTSNVRSVVSLSGAEEVQRRRGGRQEVMFSPQLAVTVSSVRVWVCQDASSDQDSPPTIPNCKRNRKRLTPLHSFSFWIPQCHGLHPVRDHGGKAAAAAVARPARQQDGGGGGWVQHQPDAGLHLLQHQPGTLPAATRPHVSRWKLTDWNLNVAGGASWLSGFHFLCFSCASWV